MCYQSYEFSDKFWGIILRAVFELVLSDNVFIIIIIN